MHGLVSSIAASDTRVAARERPSAVWHVVPMVPALEHSALMKVFRAAGDGIIRVAIAKGGNASSAPN